MKLAVIILSLFANTAFAAPSCEVRDGNFVYENAVKTGNTTTYFNPQLIISKNTSISIYYEPNRGDGPCVALGHQELVGAAYRTAPRANIAFLNADGSVQRISSGCDTGYCTTVLATLTCR